MVDVISSGQKRVATNDGKISLNQGENVIKVETKTKAVLPPSQGGVAGDIQRAIDRLKLAGGVVTLRNGTYIESADIVLYSGITLVGESFGGVNIIFIGPFSIKSIGTGEYTEGTITISPGTDTVTGTGTSLLSTLTTSHKIRIAGTLFAIESIDSDTSLTLVQTYIGPPIFAGSYIAAVFSEKVEIQNIVVVTPADKGIVMNYVDLLTIKNVVNPSGIQIIGSSHITTDVFLTESASGSGFVMSSVYFANMTRTLASNCGGHGFEMVDCNAIIFNSCPSNGNAGDGYNIDNSDNTAWTLSQSDGNTNGIVINDSSNCILDGTEASGNSEDGIKISGDSDNTIITNSFAIGNTNNGINIVDSTCNNTRITGNQLQGNGTDIDDNGTNTIIIQEAGLTSVDWGQIGGTLSDQTDLQSALDDKADADNVVESVVAGTNVTVDDTDPQNPIVSASGGGGGLLPWTEVTGTSQSAAINNGYIANNAGLVTVTIPTTAPVGSIVRVAGKGAGGWKIAQNASELIHFGSVDTTTGTGGSLASTNRYDSIELVCIVADTAWAVLSSQGNITVV